MLNSQEIEESLHQGYINIKPMTNSLTNVIANHFESRSTYESGAMPFGLYEEGYIASVSNKIRVFSRTQLDRPIRESIPVHTDSMQHGHVLEFLPNEVKIVYTKESFFVDALYLEYKLSITANWMTKTPLLLELLPHINSKDFPSPIMVKIFNCNKYPLYMDVGCGIVDVKFFRINQEVLKHDRSKKSKS